MIHVMIAMPVYTGMVHVGTMHSLIDDLVQLVARGDKFTLVDDIGNALIADCRGVIATNFYHSDCDQLVFVDSDVCWERGALLKLIDHPVDLVAGIYPSRVEPVQYMVKYLDKPQLWADPVTKLLEVEAIPAGFTKFSRNCIEKMIEAFPEKYFHASAKNDEFYPLFDSYVVDRNGLKFKHGEDYSFCYRWRSIGGQVWIDPEIGMGHAGIKVFEGHLGNYLRNR
jgi:hypothetical protein